jgi:hypothetical protein
MYFQLCTSTRLLAGPVHVLYCVCPGQDGNSVQDFRIWAAGRITGSEKSVLITVEGYGNTSSVLCVTKFCTGFPSIGHWPDNRARKVSRTVGYWPDNRARKVCPDYCRRLRQYFVGFMCHWPDNRARKVSRTVR